MPDWTAWMPAFSSSQKGRRTEASAYPEVAGRSGAQSRSARTPPRGSRHSSNADSFDEPRQSSEKSSRRRRRDSSRVTYVPGTQYKDLPEPSAVGQKPSEGRGEGPPTVKPSSTAAASEDSHLRDALRTCESQKRDMEDIIKQLQAANNRQAAEVDRLNLELHSVKRELGQWQENFNGVNSQLESARDEAKTVFENLSGDLARVSQENEEMRGEKAEIQRQLEGMRARLEEGDIDRWKSKKLLETRTEELKVAQTFLTTADQHAVADVSQMVEELNEEIYQCSVMVSDALIEQRAKGTIGRGDDEQAYRKSVCHAMEQRWGRDIVSHLQADVRKEETTLLESLLENALVAWCCHIIQSFSLESREFENRCMAMWDGIRQSHETPVARRWLAMTQSQLKAQTRSIGKDGHGAMHNLGQLLTVGGWSHQAQESSALYAKVEEKVVELTEKAFRIKDAITEGILSVEVAVFFFMGGTPYDPTIMRDAYDMDGYSEASESNTEKIVCSTGLGVRCTKEARQRRDRHEPQYEVVLKPKVLLPSALEPED